MIIELEQAIALGIHELILAAPADEPFRLTYEDFLAKHARYRRGLEAQTMEWRGTRLPDALARSIFARWSLDELRERNLMGGNLDHPENGVFIELRVLGGALPEELVAAYFDYEVWRGAAERGIDRAALEAAVKTAYKGAVGQPGDEHYAVLLDRQALDDFPWLMPVLGIPFLAELCSQKTIDKLRSRPHVNQASLRRSQEVLDLGLDPQSVYALIDLGAGSFAAEAIRAILGPRALPQPPN